MKCNHCGREWTTTVENQKDTCPFCGKPISNTKIAAKATDPSSAAPSFDVDGVFIAKLDEVKKVTTPKNKGSQWAQFLGYKPGKTPWTMSISWFGRAGRLIDRIHDISDQELLARIAREARRLDIKSAAIKRITDQDLLGKYVRSKHSEIRAAAINHLDDQKTLEQLALNDYSSAVQEAAVMRLENPSVLRKIAKSDALTWVRKAALLRLADTDEIKDFLMSNILEETLLDKIAAIDDLMELAVSAKWESVRFAAVEKLPAGKAETELLKAAATLSSSTHEDNIRHFQECCKIMASKNPSFLKKLATSYPDPDVRSLTEQFKPSVTNLVISKINMQNNKAYFDAGAVYAMPDRGSEYLIGYYDSHRVYDCQHREIASFSSSTCSVYVHLNHIGHLEEMRQRYEKLAETMAAKPADKESIMQPYYSTFKRLNKELCVEAWNYGFVDGPDMDGQLAFLKNHNGSTELPKTLVYGMAATFVCLQADNDDENPYSCFYRQL